MAAATAAVTLMPAATATATTAATTAFVEYLILLQVLKKAFVSSFYFQRDLLLKQLLKLYKEIF